MHKITLIEIDIFSWWRNEEPYPRIMLISTNQRADV